MNCALKKTAGGVYVCQRCGRILRVERAKISKVQERLQCRRELAADDMAKANSRATDYASKLVLTDPRMEHGPGNELRKLLAEMDANLKGCDCNAIAAKMNQLGPAGCRERIGELLPEIVASAKKGGLEIPDGFDPLPYVRELVEMAIQRAELLANEVLHDSNLANLPSAGLEDANLDLDAT